MELTEFEEMKKLEMKVYEQLMETCDELLKICDEMELYLGVIAELQRREE